MNYPLVWTLPFLLTALLVIRKVRDNRSLLDMRAGKPRRNR
jgi:hypothetical protein